MDADKGLEGVVEFLYDGNPPTVLEANPGGAGERNVEDGIWTVTFRLSTLKFVEGLRKTKMLSVVLVALTMFLSSPLIEKELAVPP